MDILEAMQKRHSVRNYLSLPIKDEIVEKLEKEIEQCNIEGDLHIKLMLNESKTFSGLMAKFGKFKNVGNYLIIAGKQSDNLEERGGYYGERIVLQAVMNGLDTCWVGLNFGKSNVKSLINKGDRIVCVIALGYGVTHGVRHNNKPISEVCEVTDDVPQWFSKGLENAMLAPTALNQQKFLFKYDRGDVSAESVGGFFSNVDLGIVEYHFDAATGKDIFSKKLSRFKA